MTMDAKDRECRIRRVIASLEMEGLHPTEEDIERAIDTVEKGNYDEATTDLIRRYTAKETKN